MTPRRSAQVIVIQGFAATCSIAARSARHCPETGFTASPVMLGRAGELGKGCGKGHAQRLTCRLPQQTLGLVTQTVDQIDEEGRAAGGQWSKSLCQLSSGAPHVNVCPLRKMLAPGEGSLQRSRPQGA